MKARQAEIIAERTFDGVDSIHGVAFDGQAVWFAHGAGGDLLSAEPETGRVLRHLKAPAQAGVAFDGSHLWVVGGGKIRKIEPETGAAVGEVPGFDATLVSGLAWADGALYAGVYRQKKILKIDPERGTVLRTLVSDRFVTGVAWADGDLWHGGMPDDEGAPSELRRVDAQRGEVLERLALPEGVRVSGVEADASGRLWCGDPATGKLRAVKKPRTAA
ncbi:glutamine cyclotransferase [Sorangium sp. So ce291]|uniref:Vgb family protein n=1 Tax=Sorangium sp. So ce291 TaxID=3133294 RepID=UPI003F5FB835